MTVKNHNQLYRQLRNEYSFFEFQSYSFSLENRNLRAEFCFNLSDKVIFKPVINIPARDFYNYNTVKEEDILSFVFNIGMVELVSYWKAACSPNVIIRPHSLTDEQIVWWKKLYFHGLGEFFYLNNIEADFDAFMEISSTGEKLKVSETILKKDKVLVPIGGGKDSIVTLELLKKGNFDIIPLFVNPREASIRTINVAGFDVEQSVVINRTIDPTLLELNKQGFLNGHTPFSALLAFVGAFSSLITGVSNIALSNESSANESTVPGSKINHQYSKTFEFESDFDFYIRKYLHPDINYFSFLRPINELQIARLFSGFNKHFQTFRSCNVGSKTDVWCGSCSKCMFTYIVLSPFLDRSELLSIFGKDMIEDNSLSVIFDELTGKSDVKPFECVGTPDEVNAALFEYHRMNGENGIVDLSANYNKLLSEYNDENNLPPKFETILKKALND